MHINSVRHCRCLPVLLVFDLDVVQGAKVVSRGFVEGINTIDFDDVAPDTLEDQASCDELHEAVAFSGLGKNHHYERLVDEITK